MLIVGNIIGIGIFTTTGYISQYIEHSGTMILVWILGGLLSICGGLTYAELSTRLPRAGGDFHYLYHAFHPLLGFLFGWSTLFVTYTGSIAFIAVGFGHYVLNFFPDVIQSYSITIPLIGFKLTATKICAVGITLIFTFINHRGVRQGAQWQIILTLTSIITLAAYILFGFSSAKGSWSNFLPVFPSQTSFSFFSGIGVGLIGIYFTYSGWTVLAYVAGEIKNPEKSIPKATFMGVFTVVLLYIGVNMVYLYAFPTGIMKNIPDIGFEAFQVLWGKGFTLLFTLMILIAVASTLNSTILSGARIPYAMSRQGLFFKRFGMLHQKFETPSQSLWLQSIWAVILILSGSFNQLLTFTVFVMVAFGALAGLSLFILRHKNIQQEKPYLAWGYPVTPIIYVFVTFWILINTLIDQPRESLAGLILVSSGFPFFYYFSKILNRIKKIPVAKK